MGKGRENLVFKRLFFLNFAVTQIDRWGDFRDFKISGMGGGMGLIGLIIGV